MLLLLLWLEMGLLIVLIPWSSVFWDGNYFLNRYPALIHILLNPYMRGAISGLGVINAVMAVDSFRRKRPAPAPPS